MVHMAQQKPLVTEVRELSYYILHYVVYSIPTVYYATLYRAIYSDILLVYTILTCHTLNIYMCIYAYIERVQEDGEESPPTDGQGGAGQEPQVYN